MVAVLLAATAATTAVLAAVALALAACPCWPVSEAKPAPWGGTTGAAYWRAERPVRPARRGGGTGALVSPVAMFAARAW